MTLDQFFELLPREGWRLVANRFHPEAMLIRSIAALCQCPLQRIAGSINKGIGMLGSDVAWAIINAADGVEYADPALRARLLKHCGVEEPKP